MRPHPPPRPLAPPPPPLPPAGQQICGYQALEACYNVSSIGVIYLVLGSALLLWAHILFLVSLRACVHACVHACVACNVGVGGWVGLHLRPLGWRQRRACRRLPPTSPAAHAPPLLPRQVVILTSMWQFKQFKAVVVSSTSSGTLSAAASGASEAPPTPLATSASQPEFAV